MILISKSHIETAWTCRRKEYWSYLHGGTGLQRPGRSFHTEFGNHIHHTLSDIATGTAPDYAAIRAAVIDTCAATGHTEGGQQQWASIGEGIVRGFLRYLWPTLLETYEVAHAELPCIYPLSPSVSFIARPDLILRHKESGELWYVEYKTTGSKLDDRWLGQWHHAVQVHSGLRAASHTLGEELAGCLVVGLSKGYKNSWDGSQMSPFAYGWVNEGAPGVTPDQYSYTYLRGKGWVKFQTARFPNLDQWIADMPEELLHAQYAVSPPIVPRADIVDQFFEQIVAHYGQPGAVDDYPQTFSACDPPYFSGSKCDFADICWQSWVADDPLGSGLYEPKSQTHRQPFIELLEAR